MSVIYLRDKSKIFFKGNQKAGLFYGGNRIWPEPIAPRAFNLLEDVPLEFRTNGGLWEASRQTVSGGKVTGWPDAWGVRHMTQTVDANRPTASTIGGQPVAVWPDTVNNLFLEPSSNYNPEWYIAVVQYRSDAQSTFDGYQNFYSQGSSATSGGNSGARIMGNANQSTLWASNTATSTASKNAAAYSGTVLPLPKSMIAFTIDNKLNGPWAIGRQSGGTNRGWKGPYWMAMALGSVPTGLLLAQIEGCIAWDYGIEGSLPNDHLFKNSRPMIPHM